jgi:putative transcriptional regulator
MKNNIEKYRKKLKLTQEDLANKCGVARQTIIALEQNKYLPSLELAFLIKQALKAKKVEDIFEI